MGKYKCHYCKGLFEFSEVRKHYLDTRQGRNFQSYSCRKCIRERARKRSKKNKHGYSVQKKYRIKNRHKHNARVLVYKYIKRGKIKRPTLCEKCKKENRLEGHHSDYSKPLEVNWWCKQCHSDHHRIENENKNRQHKR